jgi:hypothetical protein
MTPRKKIAWLVRDAIHTALSDSSKCRDSFMDDVAGKVMDVVVSDVIMPEYVRWRDALASSDDRDCSLIAMTGSGAASNMLAALHGLLNKGEPT